MKLSVNATMSQKHFLIPVVLTGKFDFWAESRVPHHVEVELEGCSGTSWVHVDDLRDDQGDLIKPEELSLNDLMNVYVPYDDTY